MRNVKSRLALMAAAICMAATPVAAQAGTRAGNSGALYLVPASAQIVYDDEGLEAGLAWGGILIALLGVVGIAAVLTSVDDSDDQSPGT